ncbi:MAG TPA: hypothetical protein VL485_03770 [Ktedonobacteraceae bacterium]|nr:hypothetical protein [Ktedonobacteraceae bacterium]
MMSQQQRLIRLLLVGVTLLCLFIGVYAWKRSAKKIKKNEKNDSVGAVAKHQVDTPADETLKYWTAEKMRDARPSEMPHVDTLDKGKKRSQEPPA